MIVALHGGKCKLIAGVYLLLRWNTLKVKKATVTTIPRVVATHETTKLPAPTVRVSIVFTLWFSL